MVQSFGQIIALARKQTGLSQKDLAGQIKKSSGSPISPQYVNDLERDRRNPPPEPLIGQLAQVLGIPQEVLYYHAGRLLPDMVKFEAQEHVIVEAYAAFRRTIAEN